MLCGKVIGVKIVLGLIIVKFYWSALQQHFCDLQTLIPPLRPENGEKSLPFVIHFGGGALMPNERDDEKCDARNDAQRTGRWSTKILPIQLFKNRNS